MKMNLSHRRWPTAIATWRLAAHLMVCVACCLSGTTLAQENDQSDSNADAILSARRFEAMLKRVSEAKIESKDGEFPTHFSGKPIFKYSDPARGYVAAAVWKLGDEGRPKAILVSELIPKLFRAPCISYEYISLTKMPFSVTSNDFNWSPRSTLFEFNPIPDAPPPENTPARRLIQMRQIASRFSCREVDKEEKCELRMLPQPVDRYRPSNDANADGAIFLFTFGTNPEVMLLMESDGIKWQYAAGRMTGAEEVILTIDSVIGWQGSPVKSGRNSPYTGSISPIDIPGIAKDGSELKD